MRRPVDGPHRDVIDWLLEGDPAIRWQVLRDLTGAPAEQIAAERARVEHEGWGARLLAMRDPDGQWDGGACFPRRVADDWRAGIEPDFSTSQPWTSTLPTLMLLRDLGLHPASASARETIRLVAANCRWEHDDEAFFDGEVEACINGRTLSIGAYFGADVDGLASGLLDEQLGDGGWNCEAGNGATVSSFDSTICVLEGLLEYERSGGKVAVAAARRRGEEYLLERQLFRRKSTGEVPAARWLQFSWPPRWHYDVLRAVDYFRRTGDSPDERIAEAVQLVRDKRCPDRTWLLENTHPGETQFEFDDGEGKPSRWNTLRALRVLDWYDQRR
ncbi:MAG: squalene cyclase [Mycobacteriales bacterium]